ncbi:single-stranded DNA-binding protein [Spiroplasma turonicum]|uniref:Single-stranded DNA-binding protein n=1 Tax=Spiroplasma turonicum TaxID=216946 RepID=A0A0K1P4R3_9MOLU|nr:single-stranded DNA-binding protein [Spiroplasma turonicum]AKU79268.1 single-strand DNA-binding protein [Spiroplasma turonicum]ALX70291.1 single-strand DNA-binding protein [Spiroplasma turonicum]
MNSVNLIGRITKDPELRTSKDNRAFVAFTLAVNEFYGGKQFTQFVPCFAWEKTAENMAKFIKKGGQLSVEGSLNVRQENVNGQYQQNVFVRANRVQFLSSNNQEVAQNQERYSNFTSQGNVSLQQSNEPLNFDIAEDDKNQVDDDSILWDD